MADDSRRVFGRRADALQGVRTVLETVIAAGILATAALLFEQSDRLARQEAQAESVTQTLVRIDQRLETLAEVSTRVSRLETATAIHTSELRDHESRIRDLERAP